MATTISFLKFFGGIDSKIDLINQHLPCVYYKTLECEAAMLCEHFTQIWKKFLYKKLLSTSCTRKKKTNQGHHKLFVPKQSRK